jgi:hypothetical protein
VVTGGNRVSQMNLPRLLKFERDDWNWAIADDKGIGLAISEQCAQGEHNVSISIHLLAHVQRITGHSCKRSPDHMSRFG